MKNFVFDRIWPIYFVSNGTIMFRENLLSLPDTEKNPTIWLIPFGECDFFDQRLPFDYQFSVMMVVRDNPHHTFVFITKHFIKAKQFLELMYSECSGFFGIRPLPNLVLGTRITTHLEILDHHFCPFFDAPASQRLFLSMQHNNTNSLQPNLFTQARAKGALKEIGNEGIFLCHAS